MSKLSLSLSSSLGLWQKIKSGTTLDDSIGTGDQYSVDVLLKCASAASSSSSAGAAASSASAAGKFNKPTPCAPGQDGEFQVWFAKMVQAGAERVKTARHILTKRLETTIDDTIAFAWQI